MGENGGAQGPTKSVGVVHVYGDCAVRCRKFDGDAVKRVIATLATFLMAFVVTLAAVPASAWAVTSGLCWVGGVQTARLSVSRWAAYGGTLMVPGFQYHADMNRGGIYDPYSFWVNGVKQGGTNERYYFRYSANNTHKGVWRFYQYEGDPYYRSCSVVL